MKIKYLLLTVVIFFSNCESAEKIVENEMIGSWELSKMKILNADNTVVENTTSSTLVNEVLSKGLTLHFYPDSSYTVVKDKKIEHGQWSYSNGKELKYGNKRLEIKAFDLKDSIRRVNVISYNEETKSSSDLELIEELDKLKNYKEDPFHFSNNEWRLRANRKETDSEIANRLANYILHNAYILKASYERNDVKVSFAHSRGVIKIFQGGIGAVKEEKINNTWKACFYDEADAMKAYNLYRSHLGREGFLRAKTSGDWVKADYELLLKLYSKIQTEQEA